MGRMAVLIALQMVYYFAVGLGSYSVAARLSIHAMSIFFLFLGTKMSVIGLTGSMACGKSEVIVLLETVG